MQFTNLSCQSRRFAGKVQTAESIRISVKNDIVDVLSVGVDSYVNSYEASRGEVSFYGKTNVKLLYSDGTSVSGQSYNADFTASITNDLLDTDSKLTFDVATVETKTEINANTATLTILLEVSAYAYVSESVPCLSNSDDVFCKTDSVEYLQSAEIYQLPFVVDEELTASRNITTVLLAESKLCTSEYTLKDGVLRISGDAAVRFTYISEGNIVTDTLPFKFDRELDASGIDPDSQLRITLYVKNTKVRLNLTEEEINTVFSVEIAANARVEATKIGSCDMVSDAYGSACDYAFERKSVTTTLPCGSTVERRRITASLPLDSGKTPIAAINAYATVTQCESLERRADVRGVVQTTVLFTTDVGTVGENLEIPFAETLPVDYLMPQCRSYATATVVDCTLRDAGGLQAEIELCFNVESERDVLCPVIVSAEEQPFDKSALPAIEVCIAKKGETLWELCKGLHMAEEDLLAANPEITNPLENDTRIVIFNKI